MAEFSPLFAAKQFVEWDPNPQTRTEIEALIHAENFGKLSAILSSRLAFGTAGLRGPMGAGYNHMNDLVIMQTSQGLLRYLEETIGETAKERGIVIGYDHRSMGSLSSLGFARITAAVFLSKGFKVYLLENFVATPLVAYGVRFFDCVAGIMVTASHNPKADNGFKVYWGNGSQIIPPHDAGIARCIESNLSPWQEYDLDAVLTHSRAHDGTQELADSYFRDISRVNRYRILNEASPIKIAYTAMHGVGYQWVQRSFSAFGLPQPIAVQSQMYPDPNFPTVVFPNPEEKGALDEAIRFADLNGCSLIIANDPDADRLAVAEKVVADSGSSWHVFSGNDLGVLLGHWQIIQWKSTLPSQNAAVLASVVSSRMLRHIAVSEGIQYADTLTGFKWLGNRALELRALGINVLFSYEEALGYCVGDIVCDKDGVCAAAVFAEMATVLADRGVTVFQHLQKLSQQEPAKIDRIFDRIRHGGSTGGYWSEVGGIPITSVKDVTTGYWSLAPDKKSDLPLTPDSHMIMFEFANGVTATLRTSGTEPKIKFYTEIAGQPGDIRSELSDRLHSFVVQLVHEFIQPKLNELIF